MASDIPKYRQRHARTDVSEGDAKAYTVNEESRFILVRNIPALGATDELLRRLAEFGTVERHRLEDDHDDASEYVDVMWVQFDTVTAARRAKALAVKNPFYGSVLQISYLPQDERSSDTRAKLDERRELLQTRFHAHQRRHVPPDIIGPLLPQAPPRAPLPPCPPPPVSVEGLPPPTAPSSDSVASQPTSMPPPPPQKRRRI